MESDLSKDWPLLKRAVSEHYLKEDYFWKTSDEGQSLARAKYLFEKFKPASALELGAARFNVTKCLKDMGVLAVGLDISPVCGMFMKGNRVQGVIASVTHMPLRDASFDLVIAFDVLEHQPPNLCSLAVEEVQRVSGKFVAANIPMGPSNDPPTINPDNFHHPMESQTRQWWLKQFTRCRDLGMPGEGDKIGFAAGHEPSILMLARN